MGIARRGRFFGVLSEFFQAFSLAGESVRGRLEFEDPWFAPLFHPTASNWQENKIMTEFNQLAALLAQQMEIVEVGGLQSVDVIPLVAVSCLLGGPFVIAIVYLVFNSLSTMVRAGLDANLKHKMLKLGYSAADIERVLQAGGNPNSTSNRKTAAAPSSEIVLAQPIK